MKQKKRKVKKNEIDENQKPYNYTYPFRIIQKSVERQLFLHANDNYTKAISSFFFFLKNFASTLTKSF